MVLTKLLYRRLSWKILAWPGVSASSNKWGTLNSERERERQRERQRAHPQYACVSCM